MNVHEKQTRFVGSDTRLPGGRSYCFGWDCSLAPDYAASGFIMGVAASLRWMEDAGLKTTLETLLSEMTTCSNDNGWFLPWSEDEMAANWYSTSGMNVITEALIEAEGVVSNDVMKMLRETHDAYVNHTLLPVNLPANGGPNPVEPLASGFDNVTHCGHGTTAHNIYFQYTSLHHNGATARSSVGTNADVDLMEDLYVEDWYVMAWLRFLGRSDRLVVILGGSRLWSSETSGTGSGTGISSLTTTRSAA